MDSIPAATQLIQTFEWMECAEVDSTGWYSLNEKINCIRCFPTMLDLDLTADGFCGYLQFPNPSHIED